MVDIKFIDASNWISLSWYNSGGTRAKRVLQSPDGREWYFKCSEKKAAKGNKPEKYYRYEFWSEVIAYQIGKHLGLDILRYDVAINDGEIGCISPLMIKRDQEQLIEVGRYMSALNPEFLPEDTSTRHEYTFDLLERTLDGFELNIYWADFFRTILFDAIIGNTDRHQENWAFIGKSTFISKVVEMVEEDAKTKGFQKLNWVIRNLYNRFFDKEKNEFNYEGKQMQLQITNINKMAPIYDSGSSLARELNDNRVEMYLNNPLEIIKYVNNGKAELHWNKIKLTHFQLIENLLNSSYLEQIKAAASILDSWDADIIKNIVDNIDKEVPDAWNDYCIPKLRKELITKLLDLRFKKLKDLIDDRI